MSKFDEIYRKIATPKNYIQPNHPRMDNWAVDRYEAGEWFAGMSDAGYCRWVGQFDVNGRVVWRVDDCYPRPLTYSGITVDQFEALTV